MRVAKEAEIRGNELSRMKAEDPKSVHVSDDELRARAVNLLQAINYVIDDRRTLADEVDDKTINRRGLTAGEIFDAGKRLGLESPFISSLFDVLIDEGFLNTYVESVRTAVGQSLIARTFAPSAELISDSVSRYTAQWGLPVGS